MTDNYKKRLHAELASIRTRRINLRLMLEKIAKGYRVGDALDTTNLRRSCELELRGTQNRYEELHHLLGIQHRLAPPVKLNVPARRRAIF